VWLAVNLGGAYRNAMIIGYGTAFLVLIADVAGATFGARFTFFQVARSYHDRGNRPLLNGSIPRGRSLTSYLLLPRPEDWIKWLFAPGGYLVATWFTKGSVNWGTLALAVVVTESTWFTPPVTNGTISADGRTTNFIHIRLHD
jgi:hypothetical protein